MGTIPNPCDVYETEIRPRLEAVRQLMEREAELGAEQVAQYAVHLLIGVLEFCGEAAT